MKSIVWRLVHEMDWAMSTTLQFLAVGHRTIQCGNGLFGPHNLCHHEASMHTNVRRIKERDWWTDCTIVLVLHTFTSTPAQILAFTHTPGAIYWGQLNYQLLHLAYVGGSLSMQRKPAWLQGETPHRQHCRSGMCLGHWSCEAVAPLVVDLCCYIGSYS